MLQYIFVFKLPIEGSFSTSSKPSAFTHIFTYTTAYSFCLFFCWLYQFNDLEL